MEKLLDNGKIYNSENDIVATVVWLKERIVWWWKVCDLLSKLSLYNISAVQIALCPKDIFVNWKFKKKLSNLHWNSFKT